MGEPLSFLAQGYDVGSLLDQHLRIVGPVRCSLGYFNQVLGICDCQLIITQLVMDEGEVLIDMGHTHAIGDLILSHQC